MVKQVGCCLDEKKVSLGNSQMEGILLRFYHSEQTIHTWKHIDSTH